VTIPTQTDVIIVFLQNLFSEYSRVQNAAETCQMYVWYNLTLGFDDDVREWVGLMKCHYEKLKENIWQCIVGSSSPNGKYPNMEGSF
jgi:hypothetical protein